MGHFLSVALAFPSVMYTGLLGIALVYWIFVVVGAAHVNLLGDGAGDAAIEGAAKGALEGAADLADGGGDADFGEAGDGGDGHADHGGGGSGIIAALKLRSAPATVVLSVTLLFAWIFTIFGAKAIEVAALDGGLATAARVALFVAAPILALFPTSVVVRPLARTFRPLEATKRQQLVGKLCTIRTGTVTDRFGEATLEDGGAGLVVRVRVDGGEKLGRGDQAVIVGYDAEKQEFSVAPMNNLLDDDDDDADDTRKKLAR